MLDPRYQRSPLSGEGARLHGGRWNRQGVAALYLSRNYHTAVAEYQQDLVRPGMLAPIAIESDRIANLTRLVAAARSDDWARVVKAGGEPESWSLADALIGAGVHGALVPSRRDKRGHNLVLWRWRAAVEAGQGASLTLLDPDRVLTGDA